jgi:hypothetical protein
VDSERAETHLRRVAEAELRRACAAQEGAVHSLDQLMEARKRSPSSRVTQVARALTSVRALDPDVATTIRDEFAFALALRQHRAPNPGDIMRSPGLRRAFADQPQPGAGRAVAAGTGELLAVPIGMMLPVTSELGHGEIYLLAYCHTGSTARITVVAHLRGDVWGGVPEGVFGLDSASATDDKGRSYQVSISGADPDQEGWTGDLTLKPEPPADVRWLDIPVGDGDVHRIPLEPEQPLPEVEFTPHAHSPGEHFLHGIAAEIFGGLPVLTHKLRGRAPEFRPVLANHLADGLGDMVAALQSAGALSPLSHVPAQLVTLCESLGITNHGIAAQPTLDLPAPWLSLLTHYHRRKPETVLPGYGISGAAALLPDIDGVRLAVLGLHNGSNGSIMHVHVTGPEADLPLVWIRDESGRWHTTRWGFRNRLSEEEMMIRLQIFPPLPRTASVEILAAGRLAQARTELRLEWR